MKRVYRIAGLNVLMDTFGRTLEQAKPYLNFAADHIDFEINTSEFLERGINITEIWPSLDDSDREYLASGNLFYRYLLEHNGLMVHSSAVVVDGKAYLFTANSGTGKSTHTQLWLKHFGKRAYILNDDKPAVRLEDGCWYAYGTPWSGKNDISVDIRVPVAGIACLERGIKNEITPFSGISAIQFLLKQVNRRRWKEYRILLMELVDKLVTDVPIWNLKCNMDPDAVIVSYEAMSAKCIDR